MANETGPGEARPHDRRRASIVGPVIVITAGVLLLLNNLGVLPWTVWGNLVRLWPALLILIGLDVLIGRRSAAGAIASLVVTILVVAFLVWLALTAALPGERLISEHFGPALGLARQAEVSLAPGIDRLVVTATGPPAPSPPNASMPADRLLTADVARTPFERVIEAYSVGGDGTARFSLSSEGSGGIPGGPLTGRWDVRLSPAVPIALSVDSPVSGSHIDLSQLDVTTIDIKAGVGQMVLSLPATGTLTGKIECGVGQTRLLVPRSVRAVLRVEAGLGTVAVPPGYTRTGDVYVSPVAASTASIQLDVHGGVGAIDVEEKP